MEWQWLLIIRFAHEEAVAGAGLTKSKIWSHRSHLLQFRETYDILKCQLKLKVQMVNDPIRLVVAKQHVVAYDIIISHVFRHLAQMAIFKQIFLKNVTFRSNNAF